MGRLTKHYSCAIGSKILAAMGIENAPEEDIQIIKCENELCSETCERVEKCEECPINEAIEKLADYEDAEEQGLLFRLPCKPKQIVYIIDHSFCRRKEKPFKCEVDEFLIEESGCYAVLNGCENFYMMRRFKATKIENFGETVFLTEAEAAAALQAMQEDKQ